MGIFHGTERNGYGMPLNDTLLVVSTDVLQCWLADYPSQSFSSFLVWCDDHWQSTLWEHGSLWPSNGRVFFW